MLFQKTIAVLQLTRLNVPVGSLLLMWPTVIALWIVSNGTPSYELLLVFVAGTVLMRSAGCVVNDIADRNFDRHVKRTFKRPLAEGRLSVQTALVVFAVLVMLSAGLVLRLNTPTQLLAVAGLGVAILYPFMKRFTMLPQLVLGVAFSWGILMASTAVTGAFSFEPAILWLFVGNFFWIVAYDTIYALVDRDDDLKISIGSTAILAGAHVSTLVAILQVLTLLCWIAMGTSLQATLSFYLAVLIVAGLFLLQYVQTRQPDARDEWLVAFKSNIWVGCVLWIGVMLGVPASDG